MKALVLGTPSLVVAPFVVPIYQDNFVESLTF